MLTIGAVRASDEDGLMMNLLTISCNSTLLMLKVVADGGAPQGNNLCYKA